MSNIDKLLINKDNAEIIRDTIAGILKSEIENQIKIAEENDVVDSDYNINVFIENSRPWALIDENNNPFPLVNICLQQLVEEERPGSTINNQKYIATFYIDCWGCGNKNSEDSPDDYLSTIRAWKTARIVRNILMSGIYTYLGIRDIVRKRKVVSMVTIIPQNLNESAISITACRIKFEVETFQESPQVTPAVLSAVSLQIDDPTGEVKLVNIYNVLKDDEKEKE
jgi:hypothetical protein